MSPAPIPKSPARAPEASPVMAQFFDMKARQPDALLFFRMGDFYELFFEDAARAAGALGIALTTRGTHLGEPIPMAGVPVHAADAYLAKLIRAGFRVAVCEQMESPEAARRRGSKSVVRRDIVRVVTPGTLTEDSLLAPGAVNRLAAVALRAGRMAVAALELSTGDVECALVAPGALAAALAGVGPSEIVVPDRLLADAGQRAAIHGCGAPVQPLPASLVDPAAAEGRVKRLYGVASLEALGALDPAEVAALALLAAHIEITQAGRAPLLKAPRRAGPDGEMTIDPATRTSLEIGQTLAGERQGSLTAAVDRTVTGPGARVLAARLARPSTDVAVIAARHDAVGWLLERRELRRSVRERLRATGDPARAMTRLALGRGGPRDLACLREALEGGAAIAGLLAAAGTQLDPLPAELAGCAASLRLDGDLAAFAGALRAGLAEAPPTLARDGGFVAQGVSAPLDEARELRDGGRRVIAGLEQRLAGEAGVPLKVRHNAVLGYFVEVSAKAGEALLRPPLQASFIHRQTLAGQLRFTTLELADLDARIARAADQALALELEAFEAWRAQAQALGAPILAAAEALAAIDVAAALAEWAEETGAVRPTVDASRAFAATAARHPVVEAAVRRAGGAYTPNDCALDGEGVAGPRLAIVTGPNMAGKSTFLRQAALLAILAQAGSFVPARSLKMGVVDRLFSRVGAGDDLARGRSTFMTEMIETAAILNQATDRSLVILDEIGRGTATWDGLAIAWATAEALHDTNRCRALFATHFHELAELETRLAHVANLSMRAKEWNGDLVFLHEAGPGCADRSYGVHVARLAGVPAPVVARAREVLSRLEGAATSRHRLEDLPLFALAEPAAPPPGPTRLEAAVAALDPDSLTPREALEALYGLKGIGW